MAEETDEQEIEQLKEEIKNLQLLLNEIVSLKLIELYQDTSGVLSDSILYWHEFLETPATDFQAAKHYFFNNELASFDQIWNAIPSKYDLSDIDSNTYADLDNLYNLLRPFISNGNYLYSLPNDLLNSLESFTGTCKSSGFLAGTLLEMNKVENFDRCESCESSSFGNRIAETKTNEKIEQGLKIYPNPASNQINIQLLNIEEAGTIHIIDLTGKIVRQSAFKSKTDIVTIPTENLKDGVYFLESTVGENAPQQHKFLIIK